MNFGGGGKLKGSGTTYSPYVGIPLNKLPGLLTLR